MKRFSRFAVISRTIYRYALSDIVVQHVQQKWLQRLVRLMPRSQKFAHESAPVRLRLALESLGPIFVKLGQVLSTRPDLLPESYALELAKLQDKVPPFDAQISRQQIEQSFNKKISDIYAAFDEQPVASASIADGRAHV